MWSPRARAESRPCSDPEVCAGAPCALERAGLAPLDMIRMDRFSQEKLGGDAQETGWVADFLTEQRFGVALGTDRVLGDTSPDRWLTCFRDGSGMEDLGLRNVVFSHGLDRDDAYHMQVFGGRPFGWGEDGRPEEHMPRPVVEPVFADTRVLLRPFRRRYIKNDVESSLDHPLAEDGVGYALMELPRHESREGKFEFGGFQTADGQELDWIEIKSEVADERRSRERLRLIGNPMRFSCSRSNDSTGFKPWWFCLSLWTRDRRLN